MQSGVVTSGPSGQTRFMVVKPSNEASAAAWGFGSPRSRSFRLLFVAGSRPARLKTVKPAASSGPGEPARLSSGRRERRTGFRCIGCPCGRGRTWRSLLRTGTRTTFRALWLRLPNAFSFVSMPAHSTFGIYPVCTALAWGEGPERINGRVQRAVIHIPVQDQPDRRRLAADLDACLRHMANQTVMGLLGGREEHHVGLR